jgi:hypothetical protein
MRHWLVVLPILAVIPAWADTHFRVAQTMQSNVPPSQGQCDIRLKVDNDVEVTLRGDMVTIHTFTGQDAHNDGSECNYPLPDHDLRGFHFEAVESRNEMRLVEPPSPRNNFEVVVRIHDSATGIGHYHFRLTWDNQGLSSGTGGGVDRRAPEGFSWNNVINFHGRGQGESRLNEISQHLADVSVNIDRGAKILVTFAPERGRGADKPPRPLVFTGTLMESQEYRLKADMVSEDHRLHGTMILSVDRQNVNSITMDATDGQDHLHLTWDRR